jgi:hypothetical protein
MKDLAKRRYPAVNRCIYCGSTEDLSREHIIPFGLSGTATLRKASCERCRKITGALELKLLRGQLWPVRVLRGLQSRRPNEAPKSYKLTLLRKGNEESIDLPADEYPILIHFPVFPVPGFLTGTIQAGAITAKGLHVVSFGLSPEAVGRRFGATGIRVTVSQQPVEFAREIAKIAYAYAVAELGLDSFLEAYVVPAILGESQDVGRWVGTDPGLAERTVGVIHHLELTTNEAGIVGVRVTLFSDSQAPSYLVVVGRVAVA